MSAGIAEIANDDQAVTSKPTDTLYKCSECKYESKNRTYFNKHLDVHMNIRPFKCEYCDKRFRDNNQLNNHVNIHSGKKPFPCDQCDAKFSTRGEVTRHVKYKHSFIKPHKCDQCDYSTVELSKLKRHIRMHTGERPYLCQYCDYASSDTFKLKRHLRVHTGEKPYECPVCHSRFNQSNSLKYHLNMMHADAPGVSTKSSSSLDDLPCSSSSSNKENNGEVSCPAIEVETKTPATDESVLASLSVVNSEEHDSGIEHNNHSPGSNSSSSNNSDRTASSCGGGSGPSVLTSTTSEPAPSSTAASPTAASPSSSSSQNIIKSMLSGVEEFKKIAKFEVFTCEKCGVKFTTQELLNEHTVRHTGERPFKCEICGISFGKKFAMRAHMQSHEVKKPAQAPATVMTNAFTPLVIKPTFIASPSLNGFVYPGAQMLNTAAPNFQFQIAQPQAQQFASNSFIILNNNNASNANFASASNVRPMIISNSGSASLLSQFSVSNVSNQDAADDTNKSKSSRLISNILMNPSSIAANFTLVKDSNNSASSTLVCQASGTADPNGLAYNSARSHQTIRSILGINTRDSALVSSLPPLPKSMTSKPAEEDEDEEDDPLFKSNHDLAKTKSKSTEKLDKKRADDAAKYQVNKPGDFKPPNRYSSMKERSKSDNCLRHEHEDKTIDESIDDAVMKSIVAMKAAPSKLGLTNANLVPFKRGKRKFSEQMLANTFVIPREITEEKLKEAIIEELESAATEETAGEDDEAESEETSPKKAKKEEDETGEESEEEKLVPIDKELKQLIKAKKEASFLSAILLCSFCQQTFSNKGARNRHVKQMHSKKSVSLQNLTYTDRDSLVSHLDAAATSMNQSYMNSSNKS